VSVPIADGVKELDDEDEDEEELDGEDEDVVVIAGADVVDDVADVPAAGVAVLSF